MLVHGGLAPTDASPEEGALLGWQGNLEATHPVTQAVQAVAVSQRRRPSILSLPSQDWMQLNLHIGEPNRGAFPVILLEIKSPRRILHPSKVIGELQPSYCFPQSVPRLCWPSSASSE